MASPKYRTSASKRDMRRSHHALSVGAQSYCQNCGEVKRPHIVCNACGHYKKRQVLDAKATSSWENSDFELDGAK